MIGDEFSAQLAAIKEQRGMSADDGTAAPLKPLAEVLLEAKQAKQAAFDDKWKQMKTGAPDDDNSTHNKVGSQLLLYA